MHRKATTLLMFLLLATAGCSAPLVGHWRGTMDLGPSAAHPIELRVGEDGTSGRILLSEPHKAFSNFQLCSVHPGDKRAIEIVYDANRPNCEEKNADPSERRLLRGTVGEDVLFGDVLLGTERIGFFRAFRQADPQPSVDPPQPSHP